MPMQHNRTMTHAVPAPKRKVTHYYSWLVARRAETQIVADVNKQSVTDAHQSAVMVPTNQCFSTVQALNPLRSIINSPHSHVTQDERMIFGTNLSIPFGHDRFIHFLNQVVVDWRICSWIHSNLSNELPARLRTVHWHIFMIEVDIRRHEMVTIPGIFLFIHISLSLLVQPLVL